MLELAPRDLAHVRVFAQMARVSSVVEIGYGFFTIDAADEDARAHTAALE